MTVKPSPAETAAAAPVTQWERFARAPITEALLDVRATLPEGVDLNRLASFQEPIRERYPNRRDRRSWGGMVRLGPAGDVEMHQKTSGPDGHLFISGDQRRIVQARLDGFTFNRLRPYDNWAAFRAEAHELWERYRALVTPASVSRIALRYINRIEIPATANDFKEYLRTTPEIAPELPQGLVNFIMRLVIPMERFGCMAIVTETLEPTHDNLTPFILDIDVFVERSFRPEAPEIWDSFERLRECKNTVFFQSVTPLAKELFR